ncbi:TNF receptor-associated factor 3 [Nematostella vectensis]|uniref:TNF receptor-associated factor 3 n=1 Tax=Nematostella vectensis TaxID=45351 RepID=UPI00138FE75A|nr:TNF receptor-associated factor 3 [Nematostella vectensis]XP_032235525.1 TNF receptor-associated factor 3 [Nematostella vectensis]
MVGYKYTDKDTIEASHRCSKCGFILKDAVQTDCGHRYCLSCISPLVSQGSTRCSAVCNSTVVKSKWFRDKIADREVLDLPVHCVNQHLGCPWEGELRHRQAHIENPCPFKRAVVRQARAEEPAPGYVEELRCISVLINEVLIKLSKSIIKLEEQMLDMASRQDLHRVIDEELIRITKRIKEVQEEIHWLRCRQELPARRPSHLAIDCVDGQVN